jgi:cardiolipin synthase C
LLINWVKVKFKKPDSKHFIYKVKLFYQIKIYMRTLPVYIWSCFVVIFIQCKSERTPEIQSHEWCDFEKVSDTTTVKNYLKTIPQLSADTSGAFVLEDGDGSMIARAWLTSHAEKTIDIQYFIFSIDNIGLIACDYLVRAADRGVKVRILVDDIMVDADAEDIMILDAHPNIDIKIYNPGINIGKNLFQKLTKVVTDFRSINQRMHNKIFIADGRAVITGGRNIADEYFDYDHEYNFRDRDIFLLGAVCTPIKTSFEQFWNHDLSVDVNKLLSKDMAVTYKPSLFQKLHEYACDTTNYWPEIRSRVAQIPEAFQAILASGDMVWTDSITYVSDDPGKNDGSQGLSGSGKSTESLISWVKNAEKYIDIQTPYLITTEESRKLIADAVRRGVRIRILTNSLASTDNLEAFSGYQRDRKKLLETGVQIFEFKPDAACRLKLMTGALQKNPDFKPTFGLHAKSMIIDGKTAIIGTFNLDPRSTHLNTECITVVQHQTLTHKMQQRFDNEFLPENSWHITHDWNPDHTVKLKKRVGTFVRKVVPKSIL